LIFGFGLQDYATTKALPEGEIPKVLRICIEEIDKRGLDAEGIYQVSPLAALPPSCLPLMGNQVSVRVVSINKVS